MKKTCTFSLLFIDFFFFLLYDISVDSWVFISSCELLSNTLIIQLFGLSWLWPLEAPLSWLLCLLTFPISGSVVKNLSANAGATGDASSIPGSGRSLGEGNGNPLQYSCLENPVERGAWWAAVHGVTKSQTRLSMHTSFSKYWLIFWFYKMYQASRFIFCISCPNPKISCLFKKPWFLWLENDI